MDLLQSSCRVVEAVWVSIFLKSSPKLFFKRVFGVFLFRVLQKFPYPSLSWQAQFVFPINTALVAHAFRIHRWLQKHITNSVKQKADNKRLWKNPLREVTPFRKGVTSLK
jgi:hypothetical protein